MQVVAPVRETAAQALAAALQPLATEQLASVITILHRLIQHGQWDVQHGGFLGLKYLLAAKSDAGSQLLPQVLPAAKIGLQASTTA